MKFRRRIKYYLLRLFRLKASPQQVAFGLAIGFLPCWLPTFGLGPFLSIGLAKLTRANVVSAVVGGVIGTPFWPLLFLSNYQIGSVFFDKSSHIDELEKVEYLNAFNHTIKSIDSTHSAGYFFATGAIINMMLSFIVIYFTAYFLFKKYRLNILLKIKKM
jgi:uncharacterized protein